MSLEISWWLLALIVGGSAPLWIRGLNRRWEQRSQQRTERILERLKQLQPSSNTSPTAEIDRNES